MKNLITLVLLGSILLTFGCRSSGSGDMPINSGYDDKIIVTKIDGFIASYSMSDFLPFQTTPDSPIDTVLFKDAEKNWEKRQTANLVPVAIPVLEAIRNAATTSELDEKSDTQYFKNANSNKRIVVFGHTHIPLLRASTNLKGQKTIYANSETWIDKTNSLETMHFVVIAPPKGNDAKPTFVHLYRGYRKTYFYHITNNHLGLMPLTLNNKVAVLKIELL